MVSITIFMFIEVWKDVLGYEGFYQVSNTGKVRSLDRVVNAKSFSKTLKTGKLLKPSKNEKGYLRVRLCYNGKTKMFRIHRLVFETFIGPIPKGYEINHLDENKENNALSNLSLVTHTENMNYGTCIKRSSEKRVNGKRSKPVVQFDLNGNFIRRWPSIAQVARELSIYGIDICNCCKGKLKTSGGFIWKYDTDYPS